jgi:hypothetical protein
VSNTERDFGSPTLLTEIRDVSPSYHVIWMPVTRCFYSSRDGSPLKYNVLSWLLPIHIIFSQHSNIALPFLPSFLNQATNLLQMEEIYTIQLHNSITQFNYTIQLFYLNRVYLDIGISILETGCFEWKINQRFERSENEKFWKTHFVVHSKRFATNYSC